MRLYSKVVSTTLEDQDIELIESLINEEQNKSIILRNAIKIGLGVLLSQKKEGGYNDNGSTVIN